MTTLHTLNALRRVRLVASLRPSLSSWRHLHLHSHDYHQAPFLFPEIKSRSLSTNPPTPTPPTTNHRKEDKETKNINPPNNNSASLWTQLQSWPNRITLTRMASTPLLAYWIISDHPELALVGCTLAGLSDYLDGYLAKTYHMTTTVGTYLDPLADKLVINVLAVSLWTCGVLPGPLVALWATKDVLLVAGTGLYLYQQQGSANFLKTSVASTGALKVQPTFLGKANTVLQFATLSVGIVQPLALFGATPLFLNSLW
jgi:cardiolipin synthase